MTIDPGGLSALTIPSIRLVTDNPASVDMAAFTKHLADSVVLTHDGKILMQRRPADWGRWGGAVNLFGGHVEGGETPLAGLVRELAEELGAVVAPSDVAFIGAVSEDWTDHKELVHIHFWHDRAGTITGCYEGAALAFDSIDDILAQPKLMDYARWGLLACRARGFI